MLTRNRGLRLSPPGAWKLQEAKARFSELVRCAQTHGPQRGTVHGKEAVVVIAAQDYAEAKYPANKARTAAELIPIMQKGRRLGLKFKPRRIYLSARPPIDFSGK